MKRVYLPAEIFDLNRGQAGEGRFIIGDAEPVEFLLKFLNKFHDLHQKAVRVQLQSLLGSFRSAMDSSTEENRFAPRERSALAKRDSGWRKTPLSCLPFVWMGRRRLQPIKAGRQGNVLSSI